MYIRIDQSCIEELTATLAEAGYAIQQAAVAHDRNERLAWAKKADAEVAFVFTYLYELTPEHRRNQSAADYEASDADWNGSF